MDEYAAVVRKFYEVYRPSDGVQRGQGDRRADAAESEPPGRQQHIVGTGRWLLRDWDRRSIGRKEE